MEISLPFVGRQICPSGIGHCMVTRSGFPSSLLRMMSQAGEPHGDRAELHGSLLPRWKQRMWTEEEGGGLIEVETGRRNAVLKRTKMG